MLKIIADDLGLHKSVNDGIIFLLKKGKIDGVSLMANGEAFDDAIKQCLDFKFSNIGIHLNLVEQDSLISDKPMPKNHRVFLLKYILGLVGEDYIRQEFEAQIRKCVQAGIRPSFVNGNQHLHLLPKIMDIVIDLVKKYNLQYIRIVNEPLSWNKGKLLRQTQLFLLNFLSKFARNKIRKAGLKCNDYFVGFIDAGRLGKNDIIKAKKLAQEYPNKIIELGCHPGYEDNDLQNKYKHWQGYSWQKELELLDND